MKGIGDSFIFNLEVFLVAVLIWLACAAFQRFSRRRTRGPADLNWHGLKDALLDEFRQAAGELKRRGQPTADECHYLNFLWVCMFLCLTLAVVNGLIMGSQGHLHLLWDGGSCFTAFSSEAQINLRALLAIAVVDGVIALVFSVLLAMISVNEDRASEPDVDRTVWFSSLPSVDKQTGYRFKLKDVDLEQVKNDLADALDKTFRNHGMLKEGDPSCVEACVVVPVLDKWKKLLDRQKYVLDQIKRYTVLLPHARRCVGLSRWSLQSRLLEHNALMEKLRDILSDTKGLSGSAFVTFTDKRFQEHLVGTDHTTLESVPALISHLRQFRPYSYFSFGRPPFGSVTLRCQKAPLPSDIEWHNLHVTQSKVRFAVYSGLLFIVMLIFVPAASIATVLGPIIDAVKKEIERWRNHVQRIEVISPFASQNLALLLDRFATNGWLQELPTLILLAINSLALPYAIEAIAIASHCKLKSYSESRQKVLNQIFLILNTLILPLLGVSSLSLLAQVYKRLPFINHNVKHEQEIQDVVEVIKSRVVTGSPGLFAMKYLMSATFISGAIALTNLPQLIVRGYQRRHAVTENEMVEAETPWPFAWGYWYAWAVSALVLTLMMGVITPSVYPMAALLFGLRYVVDRYNLQHGVYGQPAGSNGRLAVKAACDIPATVCWSWNGWALVAFLAEPLFKKCNFDLPSSEAFRLKIIAAFLVLAALTTNLVTKVWLLTHSCMSDRGRRLSTERGQWAATKFRLHWPSESEWLDRQQRPPEECIEEVGAVDSSGQFGRRLDWNYRLHAEFCEPHDSTAGAWQLLQGHSTSRFS